MQPSPISPPSAIPPAPAGPPTATIWHRLAARQRAYCRTPMRHWVGGSTWARVGDHCFDVTERQYLRRHLIALTRRPFQPSAIHNAQNAAVIREEARSLQRACDDRHRGPAGAQHHRRKFLSERELVGAHAVVRQQEPPGQTLLARMFRVAGRGLHHKSHVRHGVACEQRVERATPVELAAKGLDRHAVGDVCSRLHHRDRRHRFSPRQDRRHAHHAFPSHCRDFHHASVAECRQDRAEPTAGEVDVPQPARPAYEARSSEYEREGHKRWADAAEVTRRETGEQKILNVGARTPR